MEALPENGITHHPRPGLTVHVPPSLAHYNEEWWVGIANNPNESMEVRIGAIMALFDLGAEIHVKVI